MGKYTATRAFQRDRLRSADPNSGSLSGSLEYLLEVPKDENQFRLQSFLYGFDTSGVYRGYLDQRDAANYWNDYFRNTGLTWSDVRYPTKMYGFGSQGSAARTSMNFVSKNISRLYR